jgi:hypothetical protein
MTREKDVEQTAQQEHKALKRDTPSGENAYSHEVLAHINKPGK